MKKMNNKGFSLVELIIVIAIMAILVGVLAPQYIKYVEKSRKSTDIQTLDSIHQALETVVMDPTYSTAVANLGTTKITITFTSSGTTCSITGDIKNAVEEIVGGDFTKVKAKSKAVGTSGIKVEYDPATDSVYYIDRGNHQVNDISGLSDSGLAN